MKKEESQSLFFFFFLAKENVNKLVFDPNDMSITDKLGMHFEIAMTNFFTDLGTLFARYPLPVIVLSVGFAVGLSTGIKWLNVTTDPIELWASPSSRSRIEKDFFDKTFRPFYRTEQIIITAKNLSSVSFKCLVHVIWTSNVEIGVECQIFDTVSFFNCDRVLQFWSHSSY